MHEKITSIAISFWTKQTSKKKKERGETKRTLHNDKETIQKKDIVIVNKYALNIGAAKHIKKILTNKETIDSSTIQQRMYISHLNQGTEMKSIRRQGTDEINRYKQNILTPSCRIRIFSSAHGMFYRIDHMLGHKTRMNKLKKTVMISSIFPNQNYMKL